MGMKAEVTEKDKRLREVEGVEVSVHHLDIPEFKFKRFKFFSTILTPHPSAGKFNPFNPFNLLNLFNCSSSA